MIYLLTCSKSDFKNRSVYFLSNKAFTSFSQLIFILSQVFHNFSVAQFLEGIKNKILSNLLCQLRKSWSAVGDKN